MRQEVDITAVDPLDSQWDDIDVVELIHRSKPVWTKKCVRISFPIAMSININKDLGGGETICPEKGKGWQEDLQRPPVEDYRTADQETEILELFG